MHLGGVQHIVCSRMLMPDMLSGKDNWQQPLVPGLETLPLLASGQGHPRGMPLQLLLGM